MVVFILIYKKNIESKPKALMGCQIFKCLSKLCTRSSAIRSSKNFLTVAYNVSCMCNTGSIDRPHIIVRIRLVNQNNKTIVWKNYFIWIAGQNLFLVNNYYRFFLLQVCCVESNILEHKINKTIILILFLISIKIKYCNNKGKE